MFILLIITHDIKDAGLRSTFFLWKHFILLEFVVSSTLVVEALIFGGSPIGLRSFIIGEYY